MSEPIATPVNTRPGRPLGLTLAILATALIYSIFPLIELGFSLLIMNHFNNIEWTMPWEGGSDVIFSGANVAVVQVADVARVAVLGIGFLVIAVLAWRGKPAWSRYALFFGTLLLNGLALVSLLIARFTPSDPAQGFTSADGFAQSAQVTYVVVSSLVTMYLVWYMNRAPARAFYRGYYLPSETDGKAVDENGSATMTLPKGERV
jgi:hypothetical protein